MNRIHRRDTRPRIMLGVTSQLSLNLLAGLPQHLAESGWDVHVAYSPELNSAPWSSDSVTRHELTMNREIKPLNDVIALSKWIKLLREVRPTVLSVGTPKAALLGTLAGWLTRIPKRVYIVRGLRLETTNGLQRSILLWAERLTVACATDVVAVSPSLREEMLELGLGNRKRPVVIGNGSSKGVDALALQERATRMNRNSERVALGLPPDAFVVLFVGRMRRDKGVEELAEAMSQPGLQDAILLTVGATEEPAVVSRLAALQNRWRPAGQIKDVIPYYLVSDVLCLPTHREGFPNVVLEAASLGLPTVTTTATGARDSVIDEKTGLLVPTRDARALARGLLRLANDPGLRATLGHNARERAVNDFNPRVIWSGLDRLYKSM